MQLIAFIRSLRCGDQQIASVIGDLRGMAKRWAVWRRVDQNVSVLRRTHCMIPDRLVGVEGLKLAGVTRIREARVKKSSPVRRPSEARKFDPFDLIGGQGPALMAGTRLKYDLSLRSFVVPKIFFVSAFNPSIINS